MLILLMILCSSEKCAAARCDVIDVKRIGDPWRCFAYHYGPVMVTKTASDAATLTNQYTQIDEYFQKSYILDIF